MKQVYLVYTSDKWLSNASLGLVAVATTREMALTLAETDAAEHDEPLDEQARKQLADGNQTYSLDVNYIIIPYDTDTL